MPGHLKHLDPKVLAKISRLELRARLIVEGFISGSHRSPYRGFSVEFAEHREYVPGDDLRHVDWKVWSKTDRYYIKQYEEETNLNCHICVDTSESMAYGSGPLTKLEYANCIAAGLTYLLVHQQDSAGLALFDSGLRKFLPASGHAGQLPEVCRALEAARPEARSDMEPIFHSLAEKIRKRGIVVIISDLFNPVDTLIKGLKHFRHRRHDVIVLHVLDPAEKTFPFQRLTLFEGLEGRGDLLTEPRALRRDYLAALEEFEREVRVGCSKAGIEYHQFTTDTRLDAALSGFLVRRMGK